MEKVHRLRAPLVNYATTSQTVKYVRYMLYERRLYEEKPAGFTPVVRRTSHGSYTSTLMSHINDEPDHLLIITHQGRIRVAFSL